MKFAFTNEQGTLLGAGPKVGSCVVAGQVLPGWQVHGR